MRRHPLWAALITATALAAFVACGGGEPPSGGAPAAPAEPAPQPTAEPVAQPATEPVAPPAASGDDDQTLLRLPVISAEGWAIGERPDIDALQGPITVTFWHGISQQHEIALTNIIEAFEAEHPNIVIRAESKGNYGSLNTALLAAMPTHDRPVMSQVYESWTSTYAEVDLIVPVQAFINADPTFGQEDLDDFFPGFLATNSWGDVVTTLPFNRSLYVNFVNLDLFEDAGLELPANWQELASVSRALTNDECLALGFRPFIETFTPLLFMNGGDYLTPEGQLAIDSPQAIETIAFLAQLRWTDDVILVESDYLTSAFAGERIAMYLGSSAGIPYVRDAVLDSFRWTTAAIPPNGDNPPRVLSQGTNIAIFDGAAPEVQWAAWEFLKFMTSTDSSAQFATLAGYLPVRRSALESEAYQSYLEENPYLAGVAGQLEYAAFEPRMPEWESVRTALSRQMGQLLNTEIDDPAAFADRMRRAVLDELED